MDVKTIVMFGYNHWLAKMYTVYNWTRKHSHESTQGERAIAYPALQIFPPHLWSDTDQKECYFSIILHNSGSKEKTKPWLTVFEVDSCFGMIRAVI